MNFGAAHFGQTSAALRKECKRTSSQPLSLHTVSSKGLPEYHLTAFPGSPQSEADKGWTSDLFEAVDPQTLLVESLDFRDYQLAAETVVEQLREALELTGEELRKHSAFKPNFCGFLDKYGQSREHLLDSFQVIKGVIDAVLSTLYAKGLGRATLDFKHQQAQRLMKAYACLQQEKQSHQP